MQGNVALVDAALKKNIQKFVLMSSLLTNGKEAGQSLNPGICFPNINLRLLLCGNFVVHG